MGKVRRIYVEKKEPFAVKAKELFYDEVNAFAELDGEMKRIYYMLLKNSPCFSGFFDYLGFSADGDLEAAIRSRFFGEICETRRFQILSPIHRSSLRTALL